MYKQYKIFVIDSKIDSVHRSLEQAKARQAELMNQFPDKFIMIEDEYIENIEERLYNNGLY